MCWVTNSKPEAHVADSDIKVYKIVRQTPRKNIVNSLYYVYTYKIGELFEMDEKIIPGLVLYSTPFQAYVINEGFHSYATFEKVKMEFEDGITLAIDPGASMPVIVECIIPEGSRYYINNEDEVVSDKIIISGFRNLE